MISTVTFGVIAFNEERYLPELLQDLLKQTYDRKLIEVVLVDGRSEDNTFVIMQEFQHQYREEFRDVKVLENPKRVQPAGWNIVLNNSSSEVVLRIDAHARIPEGFVENNVLCINSGENVCGGPRENIIDGETSWKRMLLDAEQSMFGAGMASYRHETDSKKYVGSLFHGAYRREVIEKVGLFNETLLRTEDNEYHYRVREQGYRICYDPRIKSYYQTRNSLRGMLRQKFLNGLWIGRTVFVCPKCISLFHFVPFAFVMAVLFSTVLAVCGVTWPAIALWCLYGAANLFMTIMAITTTKHKSVTHLVLPVVFLLLHVCYGAGTMFGLVWRKDGKRGNNCCSGI